MSKIKQLSLGDIYVDCAGALENDKHRFLFLLEENINMESIIPQTFYNHFYAWKGRRRKYPLVGFIWALLLQRIFSIPKDSLLIIFLKFSKEPRDFRGFTKAPDASKFTRFKQDFLPDLQALFDKLVDITEPIRQQIDPSLASMTIFDTSGIEAFVTENNPKYANRIIRQLKSYKAWWFIWPVQSRLRFHATHAAANPEVKQQYINGHFCYAYKFGIITNGLGIIRDISFYNKGFINAHPDIVVEKKSDSPDEDKSLADSKALIPVLKDFFGKHPSIKPKDFIGDSAFDTIDIVKQLWM